MASKSTPRSTSMAASPAPKILRTPRQETANRLVWLCIPLAPENNGGFEDQHPAQAENAGQDHHKRNTATGQRDALPHQNDAARGQLMAEEIEELRGHARAEGE